MRRLHLPLFVCLLVCSLSASGCWFDRFFYSSNTTIKTLTVEHDGLYGDIAYVDPYRSYYGARTTTMGYGYTSVSGTTGSNGMEGQYGLSVPNTWAFADTNGPCANETIYNARLVHGGTADLRCHVYTGYNHSEYTPMGLTTNTVDGDEEEVPEPVDWGSTRLYGDEELTPGMAMSSGDYSLVLLSDGQLVWFHYGNDAVWDAGVSGGAHLLMQTDGNLVLYDAGYTPLWASGTVGHDGAYFQVQDDGNLVVYSDSDVPLWALF